MKRALTLWLFVIGFMLVPRNSAAISQEGFVTKRWGVSDGLPVDVVQAFAETSDRNLWIGTTKDLLRFDGSPSRLHQRETTPKLGAESIFCLRVARGSTLWIGTESGGLSCYRQGQFHSYSTTDGLTNNVVRSIHEDRRGVLWVDTDNELFKMKDERLVRVDWRRPAPQTRVDVITEDSETSFHFDKSNHIYDTPWFFVFCLALLGSVIWGVHRFRIRQVRGRLSAVLQERRRVARELHDTVIQGCTTISALLEASTSIESEDKDSASELNMLARKQIQTTIVEARQAIWDLRYGEVKGEDSLASLARIADDAARVFTINVEFKVYGKPFPIAHSIAREIQVVTREAVHNALIHARPCQVDLHATFQPDTFVVEISDDGCGFDPKQGDNSETRHYGIRGMRERMQRIGAEIQMSSAPGRGTLVKIMIAHALCGGDAPYASI